MDHPRFRFDRGVVTHAWTRRLRISVDRDSATEKSEESEEGSRAEIHCAHCRWAQERAAKFAAGAPA
jgi:hypothetical protein